MKAVNPKNQVLSRHNDFAARYAAAMADQLRDDHDLHRPGVRDAICEVLRLAVLDGALAEREDRS